MVILKEDFHMFNKLRFKIASFMQGRNGFDNMTGFLVLLWIFIKIIFYILKFISPVFIYINTLFSVFFCIFICYRILSKDLTKRQSENMKYLSYRAKVFKFFKVKSSRMKKRKTHHLYKCPKCGQILSVPKGKGKINITCPKCSTQFTKRS